MAKRHSHLTYQGPLAIKSGLCRQLDYSRAPLADAVPFDGLYTCSHNALMTSSILSGITMLDKVSRV